MKIISQAKSLEQPGDIQGKIAVQLTTPPSLETGQKIGTQLPGNSIRIAFNKMTLCSLIG